MKQWNKRVGALLVAGLITVGMTACGSDSLVSGTLSDGDAAATTATTAPSTDTEQTTYQAGVQNGGTYTNAFLGIGCTLDETWTYFSKDEILEINGFSADMVEDEDIAALISENANITDMYASDGMNTINIGIENLGLLYGVTMDETEYAEQAINLLEEALISAGYEGVTCELTTAELGGTSHSALNIQATFAGMVVYEQQIYIKQGRYMAIITFACFDEGTLSQLRKAFFAL